MGLFKLLGMAAAGFAGVKMVQSGSDLLINRHTEINVFLINSRLRSHADGVIAQHFKNTMGEPLNEQEAALLKLGIFFANAENDGEEHMKALIADGISAIREISKGKIRGGISLEVMSQTGA